MTSPGIPTLPLQTVTTTQPHRLCSSHQTVAAARLVLDPSPRLARMARTPVAAESGSDIRFVLLEEGRPHPPVAAAAAAAAVLVGGAQRRRNPTPPWLHAIRLYCIIAATAMVAFFAAEVFPRCKGKQDVLLCVVALAGAVFTGPILLFVLTTCADDADDETARVASPYTRCVENVGRSVILAVALLGLYAIYLAAVGCGGDVDGFLLAAYYGVMGVGVIVGHSVSWIMGCFLRRD